MNISHNNVLLLLLLLLLWTIYIAWALAPGRSSSANHAISDLSRIGSSTCSVIYDFCYHLKQIGADGASRLQNNKYLLNFYRRHNEKQILECLWFWTTAEKCLHYIVSLWNSIFSIKQLMCSRLWCVCQWILYCTCIEMYVFW